MGRRSRSRAPPLAFAADGVDDFLNFAAGVGRPKFGGGVLEFVGQVTVVDVWLLVQDGTRDAMVNELADDLQAPSFAVPPDFEELVLAGLVCG
jgi:hypothetical protein